MKFIYYILYRLYDFYLFFGTEDDDMVCFRAKAILSLILGLNLNAIIAFVLYAFNIEITKAIIICVAIFSFVVCLSIKNRNILTYGKEYNNKWIKKLRGWATIILLVFSLAFYTTAMFIT
jgi:hypothetical protein